MYLASHKRIFPFILIFTFFLIFFSPQLMAEEAKHVLPYPPRFLGELYVGNNQVEEGDLMVPLYGNSDQLIYADVNGKYGNRCGSSLISGGGGYRGIFGQYLLGAYFFGDSNRTITRNRFNVANPGLELMTNRWDFHINGYIPISRRERLENTFFAEQLGITDYISFSGHTQYDVFFNQFETVGKGIDGEVGLTLPTRNRVRVFLGGYHFRFREADSINGVEGGVEIPLNRVLTVGAKGRQDKIQGGAAFLTLSITLGGKDKEGPPEIQDRMLDPIPRHLATIGKGTGIPEQKVFIPRDGQKVPVREDIWFFTTHDGSVFVKENGRNNCTFENPCRAEDYNQNNVNLISGIDPRTNFYFDPGPYPLVNNVSGFSGGAAGANQLTLNQGQSMYGRTRGYLRPALDNDRPIFGGSLSLVRDHLLTNLNVNGSGTQENVGITGNGANNLVLNQVGVSDYRGADGFAPNEIGGNATGISFMNSSNIRLTQVSVSNITGGSGSTGSAGIAGIDHPGGTGSDGSDGTFGADGGQATGIQLVNVNSTTLENTLISNITGGQGGAGGSGGDGGSASRAGDNRNAIGGVGGDGSTGGAGGQSTGIQFDQSSVILNNVALQQIFGGVGGSGGVGGTGGAVDANGTQGGIDGFAGGSEGGTGHAGNAGLGGIGGAGGDVFAMVSNNSQVTAVGSSFTLNGIQAGTGGAGGIGGVGGGADALNNVNNGIAGGAASNNTDASGQTGGGTGGIGGLGGNGGNTVGISLSGGAFTMLSQNVMVSNVQGGTGGSGGVGGFGGSANASGNSKDGYAGGSANGTIGQGSTGGTGGGDGNAGGQGGLGGDVTGILSTSGAQLAFSGSSITLSNINGGTGGVGGAGGEGGSADANNNAGDAALGGGAAFGEAVGGTGAGDGGNGGAAGIGGNAVAISVGSGSTWNFATPATLVNITGGMGDTGGTGGAGGHANVEGNTGGIGNAVAGGGATGSQGTLAGKGAGDGGAGGAGALGGDSIAVVNNGVLIASSGLTISQIRGGQGGFGGMGGTGGDANAQNNANRGIGGGGSIGGQGGLGGGIGGLAGDGGNGGNSQFLTGNAVVGSVNAQNLLGGNGGSGGIGGSGGDAIASNNLGGNTQGEGGDGNNGGTGGAGGSAGVVPGQPGVGGGNGTVSVDENGGAGGSSGTGGNGGVV